MSKINGEKSDLQRRLRIWPGVIAALFLALARFGLKKIIPGFEGFELAIMGGFIGMAAVLLWWLFFSRTKLFERFLALLLMIVASAVTWIFRHESMGPLWAVAYALPFLLVAFVAWAAVTRGFSNKIRRATMVATILLACGAWLLFRTSGINSDHVADFYWRWIESPEEQLDEPEQNEIPASLTVVPDFDGEAEWPGFRGAARNSVVDGVDIVTDWTSSPPVELWRQSVGPGWSSFAVHGNYFFTQEQRADEELVSCYNLTTGTPVWRHSDKARFFESNAGPGPRATPTLSGSCVYSLGGTGIVNALDARDGSVIWSRNAADDTKTEIPIWGFSASPLVVDDIVIVAAAGSCIGYDVSTGEPRWLKTADNNCYSSPQVMTINGVKQIVMMNQTSVSAFTPKDGVQLWEFPWSGGPIVQPAIIENKDLLLTANERSGILRVSITEKGESWEINQKWTADKLKPYFNDFVIHEGYAFGLNGRNLTCIDLKDGLRRWKGRSYGGQILLLSSQDILLLLSEKGELVLVEARPEQFTELARMPVLTGKTWNHPVLINNILLVRNGVEMVAFRLDLVDV